MPIARNGMIHLNNNLMCSVDCETTGPVAGFHDLYQVCILPLDCNLKPYQTIIPFYTDIRLKRPENIDPRVYKKGKDKICAAQTTGLDPYRAADLFDEWYQKLPLPFGKKITPLAQNWPHDRSFILDWLGAESFEQYFTILYRDTMVASLFCNDRADFHNEPIPYAKNDLKWLTGVYKIPHDRAHDALQDCIVTAELYRLMCKTS